MPVKYLFHFPDCVMMIALPSILETSICLFFLLSFHLTTALNYEDCGPSDAIVRFSNLSLSPDPVVFGKAVKVDADMILSKGVAQEGGWSLLDVTRIFELVPGFPLGLRLGCPWRPGGSCIADLCTALSEGLICDWIRTSGSDNCDCPSTSRTISTKGTTVGVPSLGPFIEFFVNGLYRIRWTWLNRSMTRVLGCVSADINFASPYDYSYNNTDVGRSHINETEFDRSRVFFRV